MKKHNAIAVLLIGAALALCAGPAQSQGPATAVEIAAPIVVRTLTPKKAPKTNSSSAWMKAEILHADSNSMVVSEQGNERVIHTFTYTSQVQSKMQQVINNGGYQYGDKIKIKYLPGSTVALKIHGKPSKSS
jgi:hypothetical protein